METVGAPVLGHVSPSPLTPSDTGPCSISLPLHGSHERIWLQFTG